MGSKLATRMTIRCIITAMAVLSGALIASTSQAGPPALPAPIPIAQIPLTVATAAHPQVLFAIGNSQSMDGNLSGAIMTGSGSLDPSLVGLQSSVSPVDYTIPAGFTPPVDPGNGVIAPYTSTSPSTSTQNSMLVDNSPSRMNVAKAGVTAILNTYMTTADFGLMDYGTNGTGVYTTWVYYMSPTTGPFVFSKTEGGGSRYTVNPCYHYKRLIASSPVYKDCLAIEASGEVTGTVDHSQFMQISASSDDPLVNDVLYWFAQDADPVCLLYNQITSTNPTGAPNPANPYPPNYLLANYNSSGIREVYSSSVNNCPTRATPTNAGFVPSSPQVLFFERGWAYAANPVAAASTTLVPMTSAGQIPTANSVSTAIANFTPFLAPETNATSTGEIKSSAEQSPTAGLLAGALAYYNTNPPSSNGCTPNRYVVLVTDGLPTLDLNGHPWPPPGTTSANSYGVNVAFNADGSLNTDPTQTNAQAVIDTISQLAALKSQGIKTYVIGLGAGVDPTQNQTAAQILQAMAIAGGTGNYYPAISPTVLTNDMQSIMSNILAATQAHSAVGVNSTGLHQGSVAYLAQFTTSDTPYQDWTGELGAYPIDPNTGQVNTTPGSAAWSARAQLDAQDWNLGRIIATWDPVAGTATPFRWNSDPSATTGIAPNTTLGQELTSFLDSNGSDVLNYLRGNTSQEQRYKGGLFRNRSHRLGDIVDSAPLYVGPPVGLSQTSAYLKFAKSVSTRSPVIYVGANDGMLHAFDAATGNERFAFIPNGVYANLVNLSSPYYNAAHQFYADGSPAAADVQFTDLSWHTVLVGGEGAGGNTIYALDVTNPDSITSEATLASSVLWEFSDLNLGLTFSQPVIANTSAGWLVFFGNGYDSPFERPFLYALDPHTGKPVVDSLTQKPQSPIDLCAAVANVCDLTQPNGLSNVTVVNNAGLTSAANTLYAGDLQGNLWRVDITNSNPSAWTVSVIFQARDPVNNNPQPITTTPAVTLNPQYPNLLGTFVVFGTGQLLSFADLATTQTQSLYSIFDPPSGSLPPVGFVGIPTRTNNLVQQVMSNEAAGTNPAVTFATRVIDNVKSVNLPSPGNPTGPDDRGWFVDFNLSGESGSGPTVAGERVVGDPKIENGGGVVVVTYQPNVDSCVGGGNAWLTVLNYANGGSFPLPELDLNADNQLNANDTVAGMNPVAMSLGPVYASSVTLLSSPPNSSGVGTHKLMAASTVPATSSNTQANSSNVQIESVSDRGPSKPRTAWWELLH